MLKRAGWILGMAGLLLCCMTLTAEVQAAPKGKLIIFHAASLTFMVQNGDLDYAWSYRSLALQHKLKFISLDDNINLANVAHDAFYHQARVRVSGEKPGTFIHRIGQFVAYGIAMPKNAPNREAAEAFLAYLLNPEGGQKILRQYGQPPFDPPFVPTRAMHQKLPKSIQPRVVVKE